MKTINGFGECLEYIINVHVFPKSIGYPGWIPIWQKKACELCDRLRNASDQSTWYHKEFKPFQVQFNRKDRYFVVQRELETEKGYQIVSAIVPVP